MSRDEISTSPPRVGTRVRRVLGGGRVRAALSLGIVLGLGSVGTMASWSTSVTATSGTFRTTAIEVQLGPSGQASKNFPFSDLTKSGLLPGSFVDAVLPVQNTGDMAFAYGMTAQASGDAGVAGQITVGVYAGSTCTGPALGSGDLSATRTVVTDRGPVEAGATDTLCVRATAGNSLTKAMQGKSIGVTFTVTATSQ
ncbi:SipW-dependent-type signal peptide-containing protein [Prescottella sp. R16]|uniref:SipW-dependent-type signal peptide-containing protein n=1 Tax=Prescottella sp. R16 TaxID=3064529 RepID=UPI00272EA469|nr:SipW-dependent-type signal peptide-containing protein [Prescottella sp. R16]